jgi:alpha-ketoglutarate-dependent taurine dioxygenase
VPEEDRVVGTFQEPGHPEVMILSNIVENGRPIGARNAGQDSHTDMSYSETIALANVQSNIQKKRLLAALPPQDLQHFFSDHSTHAKSPGPRSSLRAA